MSTRRPADPVVAEPDDEPIMVRIAPSGLSSTVSLGRKVNDGNYGHGEVFMNIQGITPLTTPEEMDEILDQSQIAFEKLRERIKANYRQAVNVV